MSKILHSRIAIGTIAKAQNTCSSEYLFFAKQATGLGPKKTRVSAKNQHTQRKLLYFVNPIYPSTDWSKSDF